MEPKKRGRKKKDPNAIDAPKIPKDFVSEKTLIFGENVRIARKERGFTAEVLAKFLGISTAYVGLIERGERCPSMETYMKICEFFGESYEDMLTVRKNVSVSERKRIGKDSNPSSQIKRKQKMVVSMVNTFNNDELDFIISAVKSFKRFTLAPNLPVNPTDGETESDEMQGA